MSYADERRNMALDGASVGKGMFKHGGLCHYMYVEAIELWFHFSSEWPVFHCCMVRYIVSLLHIYFCNDAFKSVMGAMKILLPVEAEWYLGIERCISMVVGCIYIIVSLIRMTPA